MHLPIVCNCWRDKISVYLISSIKLALDDGLLLSVLEVDLSLLASPAAIAG